jgi:hypothetical protein
MDVATLGVGSGQKRFDVVGISCKVAEMVGEGVGFWSVSHGGLVVVGRRCKASARSGLGRRDHDLPHP